MQEIQKLLEKFDNFKYAEFRSIQTLSKTSMLLTFIVQDDDGEETDKVVFQLDGVNEARLIENNVLAYLDMTDGISIIQYNDDIYAFSLGKSNDDLLAIKNTPLYAIASGISFNQESI